MDLLFHILVGALVGFIAGKLMDAQEKGFVVNVVIGLIGSAIGGVINRFLHLGNGTITGFILAIIGSCLLIFIVNKFFKK